MHRFVPRSNSFPHICTNRPGASDTRLLAPQQIQRVVKEIELVKKFRRTITEHEGGGLSNSERGSSRLNRLEACWAHHRGQPVHPIYRLLSCHRAPPAESSFPRTSICKRDVHQYGGEEANMGDTSAISGLSTGVLLRLPRQWIEKGNHWSDVWSRGRAQTEGISPSRNVCDHLASILPTGNYVPFSRYLRLSPRCFQRWWIPLLCQSSGQFVKLSNSPEQRRTNFEFRKRRSERNWSRAYFPSFLVIG